MFTGKEYVYEVYREKSFSMAAKKLYVTQPALSNTVKRIEKKLGFPIFDRSVSPIQLTDAGKVYIDTIEQLLSIEENFQHFIDDTNNILTGNISIGGSATVASYILPDLVSIYHARYPGIVLNVSETDVRDSQELLAKGELDLVFESEDLGEELFDKRLFRTEHMLLAVPRSFIINESMKAFWMSYENIISDKFLHEMYPAVDLKLFNHVPFVFQGENNTVFQKLITACKNSGLNPDQVLFMNQELSAFNMACTGVGATFISDTLIKHERPNPNIIYYKLPDEISLRQIWVYMKKKRYQSKSMKAFLDLL
ncbi:MAG: LysR family transcriptional regulator [Dorea sp.]|nr:LysR family transcriptional regulator [Dorea sp.]